VTIINTIFWFTASEAGLAQIALRTSSTATVSYCDYKTQAGTLDVDTDGTSSYTWTAGTNLLDVDPAFADMANDDLHLTSSSGCLDKGDPAGDYTGLTDIDGDSRVINGRVDIGADELAVPTPTPTPTPGSSDTGILTVATNPVAGEVFVNGTSWGTSPQSRTLAVGQYTVSFGPVDGYTTPGSQVVTLSKDQSLTVAGVYVPVVAETGTLEVTTTPVAGDVLVDGVSWGAAPQTRTVSVGPHLVRFGTVAGYDTPGDQIAIVVKDQTTSVLGTYIAPSAGMGTLTVDTEPVKAAVFVDGSYVGTAPVTGSLSAGSHTVSFGLVEGYIQPADQSVTIQKDQETRITGTYVALPADKGMLLVNTTPIFAKIFVDGVDWGTAPQWRKLGVGTHVVSFAEIAGLTKPADQTVEIEKNKSLIVTGTYQLPGLDITPTLTPTTIPVDGAGLGCPCGGAGVTLILALGFGALLLGSSRWEK